MKEYESDVYICRRGCYAIKKITEASYSAQQVFFDKGGMSVLLRILKRHENNIEALDPCFCAIGVVLSASEVASKYCNEDVIKAITECYKDYIGFTKFTHFFDGLIRKENSLVKEAVLKGVCTKDMFPKCDDNCGSDKNYYCLKCCVQQKAFRCLTCDSDKKSLSLYCEVCWKKHHQGHEYEEFFYPIRCATK